METRRRTCDLGWGTVSYLEWLPDRATGPDVLLLHGGGVDCAALSWGGLAPVLAAAGHRVIAPDHPG
jgi:pimeloyl-ACP methyl ester carboxylesterase